MNQRLSIFWFRRDLRLQDNAGLYHALRAGLPVQPVFIFDSGILDLLEDKRDRRLVFIHSELERLQKELRAMGSTLIVRYGKPEAVWKSLLTELDIQKVFANHDYEPYARQRDQKIAHLLQDAGVSFETYKDQVIFEKGELLKADGSPYVVFTPYMHCWYNRVTSVNLESFPTGKYFDNFRKTLPAPLLSLKDIGFEDFAEEFPDREVNHDMLRDYQDLRDFPGKKGTSRLSIHLRFGTVSIRELSRHGMELNRKWLNELIWREFYMYILWHFPRVVHEAFKPSYRQLTWLPDEAGFERWCRGETGYPIVDAGMRELNATGFMHNRTRMITAMFLTKYLLIDWKWGEAYFAKKLADFELSSNNGGWQWSAGTGVDAAPYFRIFSMEEQTKRFDPDFIYIRKWVPEFRDPSYPRPMIDYAFARKRCLEFYKASSREFLPAVKR